MILLITGCVQVHKDVPFVAFKNSNERLQCYLDTIKWAITQSPFDKIVFCENSNFTDVFTDFALKLNNRKKFEYITYSGDENKIATCGKGYGEGEIIQYALKHSNLMESEQVFYKITGKLIVENICKLTNEKVENSFYRWELGKGYFTTFYKVIIEDYMRYFGDAYKSVNDYNGYYLENVFFDIIKRNHLHVCNFVEYPLVSGISGTFGDARIPIEEKKRKYRDWFMKKHLYNYYFAEVIIKIFDKIVNAENLYKNRN